MAGPGARLEDMWPELRGQLPEDAPELDELAGIITEASEASERRFYEWAIESDADTVRFQLTPPTVGDPMSVEASQLIDSLKSGQAKLAYRRRKTGRINPIQLQAPADPPAAGPDENTASSTVPSRDALPPIPDVDTFPIKTDRRYYERLRDNPESQPAIMRRIIYAEGEIEQGHLKRRMVRDHGTKSVDSGSLIAGLRALWRTTGEVEKRGSGKTARLVWVGPE